MSPDESGTALDVAQLPTPACQFCWRLPPNSPSDGPSTPEQWLNRHGIIAQEICGGLELRLDEPVSRRKLQELLRAGLTAAECSPRRDQVFRTATIDWRDLDGNWHGNWQVVVDGKVLGPAGSG